MQRQCCVFTKSCFLFLFLDTKENSIFLPSFSVRLRSMGYVGWSDVLNVQGCVDIKPVLVLEAAHFRSRDHKMEGAWRPESPLKGATTLGLQFTSDCDVAKKKNSIDTSLRFYGCLL